MKQWEKDYLNKFYQNKRPGNQKVVLNGNHQGEHDHTCWIETKLPNETKYYIPVGNIAKENNKRSHSKIRKKVEPGSLFYNYCWEELEKNNTSQRHKEKNGRKCSAPNKISFFGVLFKTLRDALAWTAFTRIFIGLAEADPEWQNFIMFAEIMGIVCMAVHFISSVISCAFQGNLKL